ERRGHGGAYGIAERNVSDDAFPEKRADSGESTVYELFGDHEIRWLVLLFQRADRRRRKDALDSKHLHGEYVRAEVQLAGENTMPSAMACKERDLASFKIPEHKGIGRVAKGRRHVFFTHVGQPRHGVKATAAYDSNFSL